MLEDISGEILSPGYPNGFPHAATCQWIVKVPYGRGITLSAIDFDIKPDLLNPMGECKHIHDYVLVSSLYYTLQLVT